MSEDPWSDKQADPAQGPGQRDERPAWRPGPLQFGIGGLLTLTTVVAIVFGTLRWLGISTQAAWVVLLLLIVGGVGAVALVWAIAQTTDRRGDDR